MQEPTMAEMKGWYIAVGVLFGSLLAGVCSAASPAAVDADKVYQLVYGATLDPVTRRAQVRIALRQPHQLVRRIEFEAPRERYLDVRGQGRLDRTADRIVWTPPATGGVLHFDFVIEHRRDDGALDARITDKWGLMKLDHVFPRATAHVVKGATSSARLRLLAPSGWAIETPYGPAAARMVHVDDVGRRFDRPRGWLIAGKLGIHRDTIAGRRVTVASPIDSGFRPNDVLAFVRWTLPSLVEVIPGAPQRLLIVSAPNGMWRGGLSGVGSLYLHSDRPLISANGTSTLLHELIHVATNLHATGGADWIVEGIAEYYSVELLRRSNTISERRYDAAFARLAQWSAGQKCVATDRSQGPQTAHAVLVMRALDQQIRAATQGKSSLDTVVAALVDAHRAVTNAAFRAAAVARVGAPPAALADCPA
jgi:hypothetical protein